MWLMSCFIEYKYHLVRILFLTPLLLQVHCGCGQYAVETTAGDVHTQKVEMPDLGHRNTPVPAGELIEFSAAKEPMDARDARIQKGSPLNEQISQWGEVVQGLRCRVTVPTKVEQNSPLEASIEIQTVANQLPPGIKQLNLFMYPEMLSLHLTNMKAGAVLSISPDDPTDGLPVTDMGYDTWPLDDRPLQILRGTFRLVRLGDSLNYGTYQSQIRVGPSKAHLHRLNGKHPSFWDGTMTCGTFELAVIPEVPQTITRFLPKRLRLEEIAEGLMRVTYRKEDAIEIKLPIRTGTYMATRVTCKLFKSVRSGLPSPNDVNGIGDFQWDGGAIDERITIEIIETIYQPKHFWGKTISRDPKGRILWKKTIPIGLSDK